MKKSTIYVSIILFLSATGFAQNKNEKIVLNGKGSQEHTWRHNTGLKSTKVDYRGTIVFNETDTDVESISAGGFLEIAQKTFGTWRSALLEGKSDGSIERQFKVGSKERPWDPEGAEWFSDILLDVIRSTGMGVETRVGRFYRKGGVNALINEIGEIDSDYVKGIYYATALNHNNMRTQDLVDPSHGLM